MRTVLPDPGAPNTAFQRAADPSSLERTAAALTARGWLFPGGPSGFGPVDMLVPADRLEEAEQILSETDE